MRASAKGGSNEAFPVLLRDYREKHFYKMHIRKRTEIVGAGKE